MLDDPASAILEIDRKVLAKQHALTADETEQFGVPLAGTLIPWIDKDLGNGMSQGRMEGRRRNQQDSRRARPSAPPQPIPVDGLCVRIGAMRCHSQALTIKLKKDVPLDEIERHHRRRQRLGQGGAEQARSVDPRSDAGSGHGQLDDPGRSLAQDCRWVANILSAFTVGDQLLWGAAEPLRRMLRIIVD